ADLGQALQTVHRCSFDVARGLALLFGLGTWPFHHGFRRRGGTIFWSALPDERQVQADLRTHLIHRPARDIIPPRGGARVFSCWVRYCAVVSCGYGLPGPAKLRAINPDAVHDHGQPACQGNASLLHAPAPGDLHRPGIEQGPCCRAEQHALGPFVSIVRTIASPHRDIAPLRSISPDWYLADVNPNTAPTDLDLRKRAGTSIVAR